MKQYSSAELRSALRTGDWSIDDAFRLLKSVADVANSGNLKLAREFVIRLLEQGERIQAPERAILTHLTRLVGLFPYVRDPQGLSIGEQVAFELHRPLQMAPDFVLHAAQARAYWALLAGRNVVLSAPTSFGKSLLVDAMIALGRFNNIAVVLPTLALVDETRRRLAQFGNQYKLITHSQQPRGERNIFVMTQERVAAYEDLGDIDFFVIDEFYKLDPTADSERAYLLNQVFYRLAKTGAQFYLIGPNIKGVSEKLIQKYRCVFFIEDFATVVTELERLPQKPSKEGAAVALCQRLSEPSLIYCQSPPSARRFAAALIEAKVGTPRAELRDAIAWIEREYHSDWIVARALRHGIGIHHGKVPRAIGQYLVRAFNEGLLRFLVCTSTLIEGVNTAAKNVVVLDNKIAKKNLDVFTFNNIRGRSGRMFRHFIGRVYVFEEPPQDELPFVEIPAVEQTRETPTALLVQLDIDDLTPEARQRVEALMAQQDLAFEVIVANVGISPEDQIALAKHITANIAFYGQRLCWRGYPVYDELKDVAELIWTYLASKSQKSGGGVTSYSQLTFLIHQLQKNATVGSLIARELQKPNSDAGDTVEKVLEFIRTWATFAFPKYLRAIDRIQRWLLPRHRYQPGDYDLYSDRVDRLFMPAPVLALEEYGLPSQVTNKIKDRLPLNEELDVVLGSLRRLKGEQLGLTAFERQLFADVQSHL